MTAALEAELRRRAAETPLAPAKASVPPVRQGWTPGAVVMVAAGIIGAIGTSIVAPLALRQPPQDVSQLAPRTVTTDLGDGLAAASRNCGAALERATAAESQVKGLKERLDSIEAAARPKKAQHRPQPAAGATP